MGFGDDASPAALGELQGPPHDASSRCVHRVSLLTGAAVGTRERSAARARGGTAAPVSSHPDFHGRSRNRTGSTPAWLAGGSRTVTAGGESHPAPKTNLSPASIGAAPRTAEGRQRRAGSGLRRGGRPRSDEPASRLANCFISVATATASP